MRENDYEKVKNLLNQTGINYSPKEFKRVASAKKLYQWNVDARQEY